MNGKVRERISEIIKVVGNGELALGASPGEVDTLADALVDNLNIESHYCGCGACGVVILEGAILQESDA